MLPRQQMQSQQHHEHQQATHHQSGDVVTGGSAPMKRPSQAISFGTLMPMLLPNLPKEQAEKLLGLYQKLRKSEISKEDFLRATRFLVGDQILVSTVRQMQLKKQLHGQVQSQPQVDLPQSSYQQHMLQQQQTMQHQQIQAQASHDTDMSKMADSPMQHQNNEGQSRLLQMPLLQMPPPKYRPEQWHEQQNQPASGPFNVQNLKVEAEKMMPMVGEPSSGLAHVQGAVVDAGSQARTPPKRYAELSPTMPSKSKKQKVADDMLEQSIDQLNDVTAVSGVNLREEEEQLLVGPKEESRMTQAMRRFVREEEGRLFLEKGPLRTKLMAIAAKNGVATVSEEVDQYLSMSTEERLRIMLYKLIKLSCQRNDQDKGRHKIVVTSNIQKQIMLSNKKAKEVQDKKQALESEQQKKNQ